MLADVRFGSKADICAAEGHVCFTLESGQSCCGQTGARDRETRVLGLSGRQGNVWLQDEKQIGTPHREYRDDQCNDDDLMTRHSQYGQARPQHAGNKADNRYDPNH